MLRIRFHGRGGQGIKTASQILGSAAFLSEFRAQDFPLYGAERRGAPIVASTRIDRKNVMERGAIYHPDLVLVGDESLIGDPVAAPLSGTDSSTLIFINSTHRPEDLRDHFKLFSLPVSADLTRLCELHLKRGNVLSTALAAAAARLTGLISLEALLQAVDMELGESGLGREIREKNQTLAGEVFNSMDGGTLVEKERTPEPAAAFLDMKQEEVSRAAPLVLTPGNMALRKTGNWRMERPEINYEDCNACWICFVRCPDGAMGIGTDGKPVIDYEHCKGCLICAEECPKHAIHFTREVSAWV
ncbi:MAG: hypothetical protein COV67_00515 [Nitrospinae bacterium CG11_big_fil_rev_8_21_14_0_20_56_8]|nr:MAG: hypothetical protein COV67_00515 [Nitrospinae bacterium CG11_big_fil_rev_8_21_14_0_20_56_8]